MDVKVITKGGKPIADAIVSLSSVPYDGAIPDIASVTNDDGIASVLCEHRKGEYAFSVFTDEGIRSDHTVAVLGVEDELPILLVI